MVTRRVSILTFAGTLSLLMGLLLAGCSQESAPTIDTMDDAVRDSAKKAETAVGDATDAANEIAKQATEKVSEAFTAAEEKAASALEGIDGGAELLTKVKDLFSSAQETLKGITDTESAKAAESKLDELGGAADELAEQTSKLPEEARTAVANLIQQGLNELKALVDKVTAMPGVDDELKPKLDDLADKLSKLTGQ